MDYTAFPVEIWSIIFENFSWIPKLSIHPLLELRKTCKYLCFIVDGYLKSKYNTTNICIAISIACEWERKSVNETRNYCRNIIQDTFNGLPAITLRYDSEEASISSIHHMKYGVHHNELGAAIKNYYPDGRINSKQWYINGSFAIGLCKITYYPHGTVMNFIIKHDDNIMIIYRYSPDSILYSITYINKEELIHRDDGPAVIEYHDDGETIKREEYYKNDKLHREDGPALIEWRLNKVIRYVEFYYNGKLHNLNGPARLVYDDNSNLSSESWYENGINHRDGGKASNRYYDKNGNLQKEIYKVNGPFRNNEPYLITYYENGNIEHKAYNEIWDYKGTYPSKFYYYPCGAVKSVEYTIYGTPGRDYDQPAVLEYYEDGNIKCKHYCRNGCYYRLNGPSKISYHPCGAIKSEEYLKNSYDDWTIIEQ